MHVYCLVVGGVGVKCGQMQKLGREREREGGILMARFGHVVRGG